MTSTDSPWVPATAEANASGLTHTYTTSYLCTHQTYLYLTSTDSPWVPATADANASGPKHHLPTSSMPSTRSSPSPVLVCARMLTVVCMPLCKYACMQVYVAHLIIHAHHTLQKAPCVSAHAFANSVTCEYASVCIRFHCKNPYGTRHSKPPPLNMYTLWTWAYLCLSLYAFPCVSLCTCAYLYLSLCTCAYLQAQPVHVHIQVRVHINALPCMPFPVFPCVHAHIYTLPCVRVHIYKHNQCMYRNAFPYIPLLAYECVCCTYVAPTCLTRNLSVRVCCLLCFVRWCLFCRWACCVHVSAFWLRVCAILLAAYAIGVCANVYAACFLYVCVCVCVCVCASAVPRAADCQATALTNRLCTACCWYCWAVSSWSWPSMASISFNCSVYVYMYMCICVCLCVRECTCVCTYSCTCMFGWCLMRRAHTCVIKHAGVCVQLWCLCAAVSVLSVCSSLSVVCVQQFKWCLCAALVSVCSS